MNRSTGIVPTDLRKLAATLRDVERKQLPYAAMLALNATGEAVLDENKTLMQRVFDRPTRWTLNAFFLRRATKRSLEATVERKDAPRGRHYLEVEEQGGPRPKTGIERLIIGNVATEQHIEAVVPARGAKLNAFGNLPAGQIQRALSNIGAQQDRAQNSTDRSRKRSRGAAQYFVPKPGQLSPGVWKRQGSRISKFLSFTDASPRYAPRFDMQGHGRAVAVRELPGRMRAALKKALSTAR
ncbi:hypothetical protein [Rhodovulum kholense]|uniref:Uncharacterized protein n=1 Tax=Rhodovulum kholense TaxID=453584 RepID=A0A8E2VHM0_9RHOB|nr:hypothetical protein [Rhodovulum kholense]PTW45684.1 hypothetical protein C8N38_11385 [Rhodovulum kholense]